MALTVGTDTYISITDADAYFDLRLYADVWTSASSGDKEKALFMARRFVDQQGYKGELTDTDQLLAWPRTGTGVEGVKSDIVPDDVIDAQCEIALALLRDDLTLNNTNLGVRRLREQVGPLVTETEYDGRAPVRTVPDIAMDLLRPYMVANGSSVAMVL